MKPNARSSTRDQPCMIPVAARRPGMSTVFGASANRWGMVVIQRERLGPFAHGGAAHVALFPGVVELAAAVHRTQIVPDHQIAGMPLHAEDILRLGAVLDQLADQRAAFVLVHALRHPSCGRR